MSRKVLGWNINQRSGLGKEIEIRDAEYDRDFVKRDTDIYVWGKDFTKHIESTNFYKQILVGFPEHAIVKGYFEID